MILVKQYKQYEILVTSMKTDTGTTCSSETVQAIRESSNIHKNSLQKSIKEYDEITHRNIQFDTDLDESNQVNSSIVKTVSNLLNDKNKSQFSLKPVTQSGEGNPT